MGGNLPLGYDRPADPQSRTLVVNPGEADTVRLIFAKYLELGSAHAVVHWANDQGIRSKAWVSSRGKVIGGAKLGRGALFYLLKNRTYIGEVPHRDQSYPGLHPAIVDRDLFERVQATLAAQVERHNKRPLKVATMALRGRIFDTDGHPMSPSFTGRKGRSYRYYVSAPLLQGVAKPVADDGIRRVGGDRIESLVLRVMTRLHGETVPDSLSPLVRVELHAQTVQLVLRQAAFFLRHGDGRAQFQTLSARLGPGEWMAAEPDEGLIRVTLACRLKVRGGKVWFDGPAATTKSRPDRTLIRGLQSAHQIAARMGDGQVGAPDTFRPDQAPPHAFDRKKARLAFLAPDIQAAILEGRQPHDLTLQTLMDAPLPACWEDQRKAFGFSRDGHQFPVP